MGEGYNGGEGTEDRLWYGRGGTLALRDGIRAATVAFDSEWMATVSVQKSGQLKINFAYPHGYP